MRRWACFRPRGGRSSSSARQSRSHRSRSSATPRASSHTCTTAARQAARQAPVHPVWIPTLQRWCTRAGTPWAGTPAGLQGADSQRCHGWQCGRPGPRRWQGRVRGRGEPGTRHACAIMGSGRGCVQGCGGAEVGWWSRGWCHVRGLRGGVQPYKDMAAADAMRERAYRRAGQRGREWGRTGVVAVADGFSWGSCCQARRAWVAGHG